jgi:hypothetical protein
VSDSRATEILDRQSQLENDRTTYDAHCKEVAERVLPRQDEFLQKRTVEGDKRSEKIFDSTAPLALDRAASAIDSLITPATQMYHKLEPQDEEMSDDREVRLYLEEVNKLLFKVRYRPAANFSAQAHECYVTQMAFGTMGLFVDDLLGIGVRYKSVALSDLYISENHAGIVDYWHRKIRMTARAAVQKWGMDKLPESIKKALEKNPFQKFDFLHCVRPNDNQKAGAKDFRGMDFSSYYVSYEGKVLLSEGGYRTAPYAVARHVTSPNETYGRSPAMMVLADIKMLNEMEKTIIRAAHKIVDPPLLAYGDGILSSFNTRPSAINYGGVDDQGRQLVVPMKTGSNLPIALDMTEQKRKVINDAFFITLFQVLVQNPQMTATEALIRAQEKGQLLAPTVGRTQSEFLGPIINRELDILSAAGSLPLMPEKLQKAGGGLKAIYTSPLARLRRAEDGVAILRTLEQLAPIAQIRPEVYDRFDPDIILDELAQINGMPERTMISMEKMVQLREERKQASQQQAALESASVAADAAKNLSKAAQMSGMVEPVMA